MPPRKKAPKRKIDEVDEVNVVSSSTPPGALNNTFKGQKVARTRIARGKSLSRLVNHSEEDADDMNQPLDWPVWLNNLTTTERKDANDCIAKFQKTANTRKEKMREFIKIQKKKAMEDDQIFEAQTKTILETLNQSDSDKSPHLAQNTLLHPRKRENSSLFADTQKVAEKSLSIIVVFKEMTEVVKKCKVNEPSPRLSKQRDFVENILTLGREHGERLVANALDPGRFPAPFDVDRRKLSDMEGMAFDFFKTSHRTLQKDCWGHVAGKQLQEIERLDATVPVGFESS